MVNNFFFFSFMERNILLRTSRKLKTKAKIQNSHPLKVQKEKPHYLKKSHYLLKKKKVQMPWNHFKDAANNLYNL